jgi:FecR protein
MLPDKEVYVITILNIVVLTAFTSLFSIASLQASGRDGIQGIAEPAATGLITGFTGAPLLGTADGTTQDLSLGNTVVAAEELRTGPDDILEIMWDRHAVILLRPQSKVTIQETKPGETVVSLDSGSVRVALAYNSGRPTDIVTVQTPSSRVFTRGGIFEVDVLPSAPSFLSRVASVFSKTGTSTGPAPLETVRVVEGQSGIEPLTSSSDESPMLEAGVQARIAAGMVQQISEIPRNSSKGLGLADTDRRLGTPRELKQRLVNVHITHALEVERQMSAPRPPTDQSGPSSGSEFKGTIVATSLGIPAPAQSSTISRPSGPVLQPPPSQPVVPVPPPGVTSPVPTLPPPQPPAIATPAHGHSKGPHHRHSPKELVDHDDKAGGKQKHKGNDRDLDDTGPLMTSPLPMLPAVHVSTGTAPVSGQSGGLNSRDLLKEVVDHDDKGGGKQKHKGNDRDLDYTGLVMTSPLPMLPAVQGQTMTALVPSQSGGLNSRDLLKEAFDDDKGGRKHGKGRDRDLDDIRGDRDRGDSHDRGRDN